MSADVTIPFTPPVARADEQALPPNEIDRIDFEVSSDNGVTWTSVGHTAGTATSITVAGLAAGHYLARDTVTDTSTPPLVSEYSPSFSFEVAADTLAPPKPAIIGGEPEPGDAVDHYPRLGAYAIGSPHDYYSEAYQKLLAKIHVSVLNTYPGWGGGQHTNPEQVFQQIKARNPKTRLFNYVIGESLQVPANEIWAEEEDKVNSVPWWLYVKGSSGSKVLSDFGHETYIINISTQARKDSNGTLFPEWYADYAYRTTGQPNPTLDGLYMDNVFWQPRRDGDWNLDGTTDKPSDANVGGWYRAGNRLYGDTIKSRMPGKLQMANLADWGHPGAVITEYIDVWNGGVIEHIIGKSNSLETYEGWDSMMRQYRTTMAALAAPKLGIFQQGGNITDYRSMRYGLASCLMDDGYYSFNDEAHLNYGVPWFDEFDVKLGAATSTPQTAAWQSGVYRRDFENGIALVNPKGNGTKTVTLEEGFEKIRGTQDPHVNNGAVVHTVTLQDRDGLLLLREGQGASLARAERARSGRS